MILQALYQLALDEELVGDPDYEWRPVAWIVHVDKGGRLLGIEGTHSVPDEATTVKRKPRPEPKRFRLPRRQPSRSGIRPPAEFLVDNALYVFGVSVDGKYSAEEGIARAQMFRAKARECWSDTGDEGVKAVLDLLDRVAKERDVVTLARETRSNDSFAFAFAPDCEGLVHDRDKVRDWWRRSRQMATRAAPKAVRCLVTGQPCAPVSKHPKIKRIPQVGSRGDLALIPLGSPSDMFESHGWIKNENAPISRTASESCATALNRLLDSAPRDARGNPLPVRYLTLGADTAVCYWARGQAGQDFLNCFEPLLQANPQSVAELYRAIWRGRAAPVHDPSAFYALTLGSGGKGRAIVRDWFESTVADVASHVAAHFADLDIVRNTPPPKARGLPPQIPLGVLLRSLAPLGKDEAIPAPLATRLLRAVLQGAEYPLSLLQRAIGRMRAEIGGSEWSDLDRRDARVALIKAVLNRRRRFRREMQTRYREITKAMDPTNTNPGYLLGRLLAIIERMQQLAMGDVNASVVDRFFSGASAAPKAVFPRLMKNLRHHARKARDDDKSRSTVHWLEGQVDDIMSQLDGFPSHLDLENQGLFIVGYHHMRHWLWMSKEHRAVLSAEAAAGVQAETAAVPEKESVRLGTQRR